MTTVAFTSLHRSVRFAHVVLALALALPAGASAAERQPRSVGEKTSEAFQKLKPLQEARDWAGMLAVLEAITPTVSPTSYDMALILDMKGKLYGTMEQYAKAIEAWDTELKIAEGTDYLEPKARLETLLYLAQFSYQEGSASKVPAVSQKYTNQAAGYFKRYLAEVKNPSPEVQMFYASLLYNQAVADAAKIDQNLLRQAHETVQKALRSSVHPKEGLYVLLLAILQQENDMVQSAELLEMLLKQFPDKKDYWPSLWSTYLAMANEKDIGPEKVRQYYIRAINTQERAQERGFMATPKDNLNLVNLYLTAGQFAKGTEILHADLKKGTIDPDIKNWLTLGYYYQQANNNLAAIAALKEASVLFPNNGQVDLTIAEIYRSMDQLKEAREYYRSAIKKGSLDKPHMVLAYLANVAFSLEDLDEAKAAIDRAYKDYPKEAGQDTFLPQLKNAVDNAIEEREAAKKARTQ